MGIIVILGVSGLSFVIRSAAWRLTLGREHRRAPLWNLVRVYLVAESVGALFFGGLAVADTTRVLLLRNDVPTIPTISSAILDRGLYLMGGAVILAAAIIVLPVSFPQTAPRYIYGIGIAYLLIMAALWIAMRKRIRLISGVFSLASKLSWFRAWTAQRRINAAQVEDSTFHFLNTDRPSFWSAVVLNVVANALGALEVLLLLWYLGGGRSPWVALGVEGMTKILNTAGLLIPGNVGTYEAGNMMILRLLGFPASIGLTLALLRDVRRLFWIGAGLVLFLISDFRRLPPLAELQKESRIF
jgi:hypothetical protein